MDAKTEIAENIAQTAESVAQAKPWVEKLVRFGYAIKGLVYLLIGLLAAQAAVGLGGETTGTEGALKALQRQPFGQILLILTAVGLFGYALWRLIQAVWDPDHSDSTKLKRIIQRVGYLGSALIYGLLGWEAVRMVMGFVRSDTGRDSTEHWVAELMAQPFGPWLVGIAGLITLGVGCFQIYYGIAARFRNSLKLHETSSTEQTWAIRSGRLGYSARGVIYLIIGTFLIWAGIEINPDTAVGMEEALDKVAQQPFGAVLLALVALGLIAYAVFAFVQARYRNIEVNSN